MQHTRGPWVTGNTDPLLFGVKRGNGTEPLGFVYGPSFPDRSEVGQRALANAQLVASSPAMAAALDCIVRRLQMDVDDGSRPDQWSMQDLIRTAKAALPAGWVIGAA
jgi:hypothetical protein